MASTQIQRRVEKKSLEQLFERLERNQAENVKLTLAVSGTWFVFALLFSLKSIGTTAFFALFLTALIHFWMGRSVVNYTFGYIFSKATNLSIFSRTIREYWRWYVLGLTLVLICFPINVWVGIVVSLIGGNFAKKHIMTELAEEYISGTRPMPLKWLRYDYEARRPPTDPGVFWGGLMLPTSEVNTHFRLTGGSGSGKTNLLRLYMQTVLPYVYTGSNNRALIFDPKTEFVPLIVGMGIPIEDIRILNIFDNRADAWNMAADLTRDRDANALANLLLPEKESSGGGNNEFFDKAARRILSALAKLFMRTAPGNWWLRDLVLASQNLELITLLLTQDRKLRRNLQVLGTGDTVGNVMATISATIGNELETVAAYCDYHMLEARTFTLKDWIEGSEILLLGSDPESEDTLRPLNQLIFTRASQMLLSRETGGNSYVIIDELPAIGKIKGLDKLAELGRSFGVSITVAFQTYSKLEHIHGEKVANALMAQFDKAAYLRTKDKSTAQWLSEQIGTMKTLWKPRTKGTSSSSGGVLGSNNSSSQSTSTGQQRDSDPIARVEDFMNMPKPDKKSATGVHGWFRVDNHVYQHEVSSAFLSKHLKSEDTLTSKFEAAPEEAEDLRLWDEEDIERLGIGEILSQFDSKTLETLPVEEWVCFNVSEELPSFSAELENFDEE